MAGGGGWLPAHTQLASFCRKHSQKGSKTRTIQIMMLLQHNSPIPCGSQSTSPHNPSLPEASSSPRAHISLPGMSSPSPCPAHLSIISPQTLPPRMGLLDYRLKSGVPCASLGSPQTENMLSEDLVGRTVWFICLLPVEPRFRQGRSGFQP